MSKISERLNKLGHNERSGIGFGARTKSTKIPVILVGANIDSPDDAKGVDADIFILATDSKGATQKSAVKDADIWGVSVAAGSEKEITAFEREPGKWSAIEYVNHPTPGGSPRWLPTYEDNRTWPNAETAKQELEKLMTEITEIKNCTHIKMADHFAPSDQKEQQKNRRITIRLRIKDKRQGI